jgi:hypothetical protein
MDVIGFLYVTLCSSTVQFHDSQGSRRACACSDAGFSIQNGDDAWGVYYRRADSQLVQVPKLTHILSVQGLGSEIILLFAMKFFVLLTLHEAERPKSTACVVVFGHSGAPGTWGSPHLWWGTGILPWESYENYRPRLLAIRAHRKLHSGGNAHAEIFVLCPSFLTASKPGL